jgi:hypothetical protein
VHDRYNNDPRTLPWCTPAMPGKSSVYSVSTLRGSVCYANKILRQGNNLEGETVLTYIGVQYAILCRVLERCLKCCRTALFVFKSLIYPLHNSMFLFYCGVPLSEAEPMLGY